MKRLIALLLLCSAILDIAQQAYSIDLIGSIEKRRPGTNIFAVLSESSIVTTIEHWALFLIGFGVLALAMSIRKPGKPNALPRR
jgi:hypothetical protein